MRCWSQRQRPCSRLGIGLSQGWWFIPGDPVCVLSHTHSLSLSLLWPGGVGAGSTADGVSRGPGATSFIVALLLIPPIRLFVARKRHKNPNQQQKQKTTRTPHMLP